MKPIKRGLLPDTVTICNSRKDPDTGKAAHFRTCLSFTRFMTEKRGRASSKDREAARDIAAEWWVDPVSSEARECGGGAAKRYAEPHLWETLPDRAAYWTIREGDLVARGDVPGSGTDSVADVLALPHYTAARVTPVFDKPGNVHHWEVELV